MLESIATCLSAVLKASWQGGVLILLVLAAQWVLGKRLSPRWRYALWLLVVIRLMLLWTIPSSVSLFNLLHLTNAAPLEAATKSFSGNASSIAAQATVARPANETGVAPELRSAAAPELRTGLAWLLGVWLAGAAALTIYLLLTQYRFTRRIKGRRPLIDVGVLNLMEDCKQEMGVRVPITLVETRQVGSPALFGFIRPRLLLPEGLTQSFSPEELRHIFLHELGHVKRHDILTGWLAAGLQILHWFNPLVWLAFHRMRVDRELACDALALSHVRENENQAYGDTIIKLLNSFGRSAWAPSLAGTIENKNQMKERISMIATYKKANRGFVLALALLAGLGLVTLTDAESGTRQPGPDLTGTWVKVGSPGEVGEAPAFGGEFKTVTDTNWSLTLIDPETGVVTFNHGGTWTLNGDVYSEKVEFANQNTSRLIHHTFNFRLKVDGDTITLVGIGNPWKEVWQRVKSGAPKPLPSDAIPQGKWRGTEAGKQDGSTATLELHGSDLEFHGADTNEWYKATFTLYDSTPKQFVVRIKECPVPQYVGTISYAIYELQDGTLTITGNEPGNPTVPAGFDAPGSRKLIFKKE